MAQGPVFVTGFKEIDAKLRALPNALQRKFVRKALKKSGKRDAKETKKIIHEEAHDTGAYEQAIKVRALKRSRTRIGVAVIIDRDTYFAKYEEKHGKPPNPAAGETEPFFVPAVLEFGSEHKQPIRASRRALYDNKDAYLEYFKQDLLELLREAKTAGPRSGTPTNSELRDEAVRAGEKAYRDASGRLQATTGGFISLANARALGYTGK